MPNKKNLQITPVTELNFILDAMVSTSPATVSSFSLSDQAYKIMEDFIANHFRVETRYCVVFGKDNIYQLYIYTKPNRTNIFGNKKCIHLDIEKNELIASSDTSLEGLVLIKSTPQSEMELFDFYKSITLKKIAKALPPEHPYHSENFLYLNFNNVETQNDFAQYYQKNIGQVKQQFHEPLSYSFYEFKITDEKNYATQLQKDMTVKLAAKKWVGSITVIFDAHGREGCNELMGANITGQGVRWTHWKIKSLMTILDQFHFSLLTPLTSLTPLIFDFYTCFAGQSTAVNASFVAQFNEALIKQGYQHFSVKGNLKLVYGINFPGSYTLHQSPSATVQYGFLTLPLTTFESLKNTEAYIKIFSLPNYSKLPKRLPDQQAVIALKQWANHLIDESKKTLNYKSTHEKLQKMLREFEALNEMIVQMRQEIESIKINDFCSGLREDFIKFEEYLADAYFKSILSKSPDFTYPVRRLKEEYNKLFEKIDSMKLLKQIKQQIVSQNFFSRQADAPILKIIFYATKGIKSPREALDEIAKYQQLKTIKNSENIESLQHPKKKPAALH